MRRCVSYSDLASTRRFERSREAATTVAEVSDLCDCKPLKRSRSDQSLADVQQLGSIADAAITHPGVVPNTTAATRKQASHRVQRSPSLPVVFSDAGSSSCSLPSLDTEVPSSAPKQQLSEQTNTKAPTAALAGGIESATDLERPATPLGRYPLSPSEADLVGAYSKRSYGALYSSANISSAASLTQYAYAGSGTLERTASDASVSSAGGQSYLARLQQLVPPLPPYSPPPLFSPGPLLTASATNLLASPRGHGTGWFGNISTILQQTQAAFQDPAAAVKGNSSATGAAVGGWGAAGRKPAIPSIDSMDSITSVEAGEHLLGLAYSVPGGSSGVMQQAGSGEKLGVEVGDGGATNSPQLSGHLCVQSHVGQEQQRSIGEQQAIDAAGPVALKATRTFVEAEVGTANGLPESTHMQSSKPPARASSNPLARPVSNSGGFQQLQQQQGQQSGGSLASNCSYTLGSGPLELQTVSSMLGCEGEQLLVPDHSTGAINPSHIVKLQSAVGTAATSAPTSSSLMQSSLDLTARMPAAPYRSEQQTSHAGTAGHDSGMPQSPVGTSPASHSISSSAATASWALGAGGDSGSAAVFLPVALPNTLQGATSSLGAASSHFTTAAPAVKDAARSFGFRQTTSVTANGPAGAVRAVQGAAAAAAAAAAAQALTPVWRGAAVPWTAAGSGGVPASAPFPYLQVETQQQCGSGVSPVRNIAVQSSAGASRQVSGSWSFTQRPASFDCGRPLGSRTRGSLELNMPWRTKLDAVIAQVTADALELPPQPAVSTAQPSSGVSTSAAAGRPADGATNVSPLHDDPFSPFAAMGAVSEGLRHQGSMVQQHGSETLLPLLESDQEQQEAATTATSGESEVAGAGGTASPLDALSSDRQPSPNSTDNSSTTNGARTNGTFSGTSTGALPYNLAAGTVGGRWGASEMARAAGASLSELETARSYGLEFDGAVVMQNVDRTAVGPQWSEGIELLAGVHQQQQEQPVADTAPEGGQPYKGSLEGVQALSQQQQQQLASSGSPPVEPRLQLGPASCRHVIHQDVAWSTAASALSGHHPPHEADCSTQGQLGPQPQQLNADSWQEGSAGVGFCLAKQQLLPAVSPDVRHQVASADSFSSSVSSMSNRLSAGIYGRRGAGSSSSSAAYELFVRLNRARQTLDFAKRQAELFAELDRAELGIWEALDLLNEMGDFEAVLLSGVKGSAYSSSSGGEDYSRTGSLDGSQHNYSDAGVTPDMPLKEHALQVAELCRLSFPGKPWMALVGLIHGLGKLLAHPIFGNQPQWAIAGESYPLGCKFAPQISHSEFFSSNLDRRRRAYSSALGIYTAGCGLRNVYMSWGAPEYLYMLLVLNQTDLPEEALFMVRYQRCTALTRPGGAYRQLMSELDKSLLPLLAAFQGLIAYKRVQLPPEALKGEELIAFYNKLIAQYLGEEKLFW